MQRWRQDSYRAFGTDINRRKLGYKIAVIVDQNDALINGTPETEKNWWEEDLERQQDYIKFLKCFQEHHFLQASGLRACLTL